MKNLETKNIIIFLLNLNLTYSMVHDHAMMIHYEKQNQQVHKQTCIFTVLYKQRSLQHV